MSTRELPHQTNELGGGPIINASPEVLAFIQQVRDEEYVPRGDREQLMYRGNHALGVGMYWFRESGDVVVEMTDRRTGETNRIPTDPEHALDAYYHPCATGKVAVQAFAEAA